MADFHQTRMGQVFFERTMPDLVRAVERLADAADKRDPTTRELIDRAADLCDAAEALMDVEIVPGSPRTVEAFERLRASAKAVRRVLAKIS